MSRQRNIYAIRALTTSRQIYIPKFQVLGQTIHHSKEPVFESVGHFLSTMKKVLTAGKSTIDSSWKIWPPMAFDHDHDPWYETNLQGKDLSWAELEMGSRMLTMTMGPNESILDYGMRFQKACREDGPIGVFVDAMIFMSSLYPDLCTNIKLAWFARHTEMPQTIEQVLLLTNGVSTSHKKSNPYWVRGTSKKVGIEDLKDWQVLLCSAQVQQHTYIE
ncbi:hypothetical protein F4703DRAFT_1933798 [Phycomyces blakesleeanus]